MSNIKPINLADHINSAIDKINENFTDIESGNIPVPTNTDGIDSHLNVNTAQANEFLRWNGTDYSWDSTGSGDVSTEDITNIINNILDSDYFLSVINEEYLEQFIINTNVSDSDIQANASAIFTLESRIDNTDSGILVLSQALIETQASLDSMVLGGIDSDLLTSAIASANSTIISRIDANSDGITSFAGVIDSVENSILLFNSDTNERIDINVSAISGLTSRISVNSDGIEAIVQSVDSVQLTLEQFIAGGINITPEMVESAMGTAISDIYVRLNADSDRLSLEAGRVDSVSTSLLVIDSDIDLRIENLSEAQSRLISRTEYNSDQGIFTSYAEDVTELNNVVFVTDSNGEVVSAISEATSSLTSEINIVNGRINSVTSAMETRVNAKIDSDIAAATDYLEAYVDSQGNTVSTWGISLVAGTEDNPKVAGVKFGNNGTTSDFAITTDTFKILPTDGSGTGTAPFSVSGNVVELSDAKVTGEIDVTTSDSDGSMNIKGNLITISDSSGNPRVRLGKLTS